MENMVNVYFFGKKYTVPADLTKMTVNLQGPFVINVEERKACQIILEGDKYPVKYPVYDILKSGKAGE